MRKIILYAAISADDFIADSQGQIEWLEKSVLLIREGRGLMDQYK